MFVRAHAIGRTDALKGIALAAIVVLLSACVTPPPPGIGAPVAWRDLPGWNDERPAQAWSALELSCARLATRDAFWRSLCADAALYSAPDDATARAFFETRFQPHAVHGDPGRKHDGLITGYYEPLLHGRLQRSERFRHPVYGVPEDLLIVDLGSLYPELQGRTLRGRLEGRRVVPYPARAEIAQKKVNAPVLAWVDDPVALFFLQVQGSGRIRLENSESATAPSLARGPRLDPIGETLFVGYADQNGHPYRAIGNTLLARGALKAEEINLDSLRHWLATHPREAEDVLNSNPSYVFFARREQPAVGALQVPLTPQRSIAVDPAFIPLGLPLWLDTALPDATPYRRLVFAQDTGGAIKGPVRADLFFGFGPQAEKLAGSMKSPGRLFVLLPAKRGN
jgi:membrane-bound lytic murein transglycosylase A